MLTKMEDEEKSIYDQSFKCGKCDQQFITFKKFDCHMKRQTCNDKQFKCITCSKYFKYLRDLKIHERIHTGERPYKCQFCNEGFVQSTRRRQHEATCKMRRNLAQNMAAMQHETLQDDPHHM